MPTTEALGRGCERLGSIEAMPAISATIRNLPADVVEDITPEVGVTGGPDF